MPNTQRVAALSPVFGMRFYNRDDLAPRGFSDAELAKTYAALADSNHNLDMLLESASFEEVDSYLNPGIAPVDESFILEAIVVEKFSKTEHRMKAVVRTLNRHLADSGISALDPQIGTPRKSGGWAYVTVQIPFSDGQSVSVIFHAPEGDKRRISENDTIIAFRWLLNRRDITHVVAPEEGSEVSLETLAKRISQLVVKNSERFQRTQKEAEAERRELEAIKQAVSEAEQKQADMMNTAAELNDKAVSLEAKLANTLALLEKQKGINAELQARIDALRKLKEHEEDPSPGKGKSQGTNQTTDRDQTGDTGNGPQTGPEAAAEAILQDIIAGKYDTTPDRIDSLLDEAAASIEQAGLMERYDDLLNAAADHYTEVLEKESN